MKGFIFPGQGSQFVGMAKDLDLTSTVLKEKVTQTIEILGFDIFDIMTNGTEEDLRQTKVTQPAIFLHSIFTFYLMDEKPMAVAGHSLGEFSSLVANGVLSFVDGLSLVKIRAESMQKACDDKPGTMAAILGMEDDKVEEVCTLTEGIVVAANYNCPGQLVISGELEAIELACGMAKEKGAKRAIKLPVGGAFHSPLMKSAEIELVKKINETAFSETIIPIYQNVTGLPTTDPELIKTNLIKQLTGPVKWTQTIENMAKDGFTELVEVGPGKTLKGLVGKINRDIITSNAL